MSNILGTQYSSWLVFLISYVGLAIISLFPVIYRYFKPVKLHPGGISYKDSIILSDEIKTKIEHHISRIEGTLYFWKHQTSKYKTFHNYSLFWITLASVLIPILAQAINTEDSYSKILVTVMSAHVAILLAFNKVLKVEENYKAFRHGESEYYDLYRRLLDRPNSFGDT